MKNIYFFTIALFSIILLVGCGVTDKNEGVIKIMNKSSSNTDIKDIYIRRSNVDNWGEDKLSSGNIEPGDSKKYIFDKCDRDYDFKVVYLDDTKAYKHDTFIGCYTKKTLEFKD